MDLKVGDKVRIKSKELFKNSGFFSSESSVLDCCGKEATITEITVYGFSLDIGPKDLCWLEACFEPMGYWSANMPKYTELKKTVTVNVPNDMEVSTEEYDGNITVKIQHKEEKVEGPKFKNGDIIYVQERAGGYIAIFQNMRDDVIDVHASLCLKTGLIYTNLNGKEILHRNNILSIIYATKEEKKELFDKLAKQKQLHWNAEEFKFEPIRWRAEHGEMYWHITGLGTIIYSIEYFNHMDNILYNLRNYFKTEELAKKALPKYKEFFENLNIK